MLSSVPPLLNICSTPFKGSISHSGALSLFVCAVIPPEHQKPIRSPFAAVGVYIVYTVYIVYSVYIVYHCFKCRLFFCCVVGA